MDHLTSALTLEVILKLSFDRYDGLPGPSVTVGRPRQGIGVGERVDVEPISADFVGDGIRRLWKAIVQVLGLLLRAYRPLMLIQISTRSVAATLLRAT